MRMDLTANILLKARGLFVMRIGHSKFGAGFEVAVDLAGFAVD